MSLEQSYRPFELPGKDYYPLAGIAMPDTVELRHMTVKEIRYFNQLAETNDLDKFLDGMLPSCSRGAVPWDSMLEGDRVFLFYMLRAMTMDNIYAFDVICGGCGKVLKAACDIFDLPVRRYDTALGYPIRVPLPKSNTTASVVLPTRGMGKSVERDVAKYLKEAPAAALAPEDEYHLRRIVTGVDGYEGIHLIKFLSELHYKDYKAIEKTVNGATPKLIIDQDITCDDEKCSYTNLVRFSVRPQEFFLASDA